MPWMSFRIVVPFVNGPFRTAAAPTSGPRARRATRDAAMNALAGTLAASNPEAMAEMKRVFWEGTEHWENLLASRARVSGRLVLSRFTRDAIAKFRDR